LLLTITLQAVVEAGHMQELEILRVERGVVAQALTAGGVVTLQVAASFHQTTER
jgi:hypothetical protein